MRLGGLGFRVRARDGVRLGMYDISLSYMMYQPVSHSIPLTIILRSAKYPCRSLSATQRNGHIQSNLAR